MACRLSTPQPVIAEAVDGSGEILSFSRGTAAGPVILDRRTARFNPFRYRAP
jgi:hypothetical protein